MTADHVDRNRTRWNRMSAEYQRTHAPQLPVDSPTWGVWGLPETELKILGDVAGRDVLEIGCGGAQWSICLARAGARATGVDLSDEQIAYARSLAEREGIEVRLERLNAEELPYADASFDVVFCDHGATSWGDPRRVVPEAARVLRPGGLLAFNMATPLVDLCWDDQTDKLGTELKAAYFGMLRFDDEDGVGFQLPYGDWIRLFAASGLVVEDLVELRPPEGATSTYDFTTVEWARRWPAEHIWKARRPG
jgi:SAM-dependent methyltransferase